MTEKAYNKRGYIHGLCSGKFGALHKKGNVCPPRVSNTDLTIEMRMQAYGMSYGKLLCCMP